MALVGQDLVDRPDDSTIVATHHLDQRTGLANGDPAERRLDFVERMTAGQHRGDGPKACLEPGTASFRRWGRSPDRTAEDLPDPDGPTTVSNLPADPGRVRTSTKRAMRRSRSEEVGGIGLPERHAAP